MTIREALIIDIKQIQRVRNWVTENTLSAPNCNSVYSEQQQPNENLKKFIKSKSEELVCLLLFINRTEAWKK